jgi:protein involved in polysaccharide export with SLBB domain
MIKRYKQIVYFIYFFIASYGYSQTISLEEAMKAKSDYERGLRGENNLGKQKDSNQVNRSSGDPNMANIIPYEELNVDDDLSDEYYYGYDYFTSRDTIPFWENLPTPRSYLLGPGDELVVVLWGETQFRSSYIITREGTIFDDKVGLLNLMGKSISEAEEYLISQFGRVYSTLRGVTRTSYLDISLGKLRTINVNFVGGASYPGVYPLHPFSNVITGLIQSGGVDTIGTLRAVQIKRYGEPTITVDLYSYFVNGNMPKKIQLRDQDIVYIPIRKSIVKIDSSVFRPGYYEALPGETIKDIINFAGGLKATSSSTIAIQRIQSIENRQENNLHKNFYIEYRDSELFEVNNGDIITINDISNTFNNVEIIGQVKNPGIFNYYQGMNLQDLIKLSGGFSDTTFYKTVYKKRAEIIRRDPTSIYDQVIEIDLRNLDNNGQLSFPLESLDRFIVHENRNFFEKENVIISGEVNVPGSYPVLYDKESLESFIDRSGGITKNALENGVEIYRSNKYFVSGLFNELPDKKFNNDINYNRDINIKSDKVRVAWKNKNISLMPGDSVIVKKKTSTVYISGAVYNPGVVEFFNGKSIRYYINAAGGLTDFANKSGIVVLYPNGIVSPKKWLSSPKIIEGSTIIISEKEPENPFDMTQFATNWTSIISSMITAIVLSQQL